MSNHNFQEKPKPADNDIEIHSSPNDSASSDGSDICVVSHINSTVITSFSDSKKTSETKSVFG